MDAREALLVDLSQWLGRVQQYSPTHPMSAQMGEKTLASLGRALAVESPLAFGVLKEDVLVGENPAKHPTIKNRLAPHLHERGVLVLRFIPGASLEELQSFVVLLGMQPQNVFDKGGLARLARERGVGHVQIDEIAHELTSEEREAQRRRKKLGDFFAEMLRNMLARRDGDAGDLGEHLAEMLEHPEIAASILEADAAGIAEAAAGLALMTRQEEARSGSELGPKLRDVLLRLAPASRDRLLLGLPSLLGEFRAALAWAVEGLEPEQLARLFFPSIRAHANDLDATLYAAGAAVAHDGRRLSALRCAGLLLFDLPAEDAAAAEVLAALAAPVPDYDSYRRERECLREPAARARAARSAMPAPSGAAAEFDGRRAVEEVIALARATRSFDRFAARLPPVAGRYAASGAVDGAIGVVGGLARAGAEGALREACVSSAAAILADLDRKSAAATPAEIDESSALLRHFVAHAPAAVLGRLDVSESRKMRRMLLDALPAAGASLLPELVVRLRSSSWFVVRNAVGLLARCGGSPALLAQAAQHPNERVRVEVMRALRAMPPDATTMDIAAKCLLDAHDDVRTGARGLLRGELLGPSAIGELQRIAMDDTLAEPTRRSMIDLLARSPRDEAAAALFAILQPRGLLDLGATAAVRDAAADALVRSSAPRARELLAEGLRSSVWRVRKACERAAGGG